MNINTTQRLPVAFRNARLGQCQERDRDIRGERVQASELPTEYSETKSLKG